MNEHDSEIIAGMLSDMNMEETEGAEEAGIVIFNTCSVRENADKRFFGMLGSIKKKKMEDPGFLVCVCGCMMQQQIVIDRIKEKYPWIDIIFGTHNIHEFPRLIRNVLDSKEPQIDIWDDSCEIVEDLPSKRLFKHKALVSIMYGCNNFCTYCIVPYTRGREKSRKPEYIINEIEKLSKDGVREVMLLGQNVNSYRGDERTGFAELIYRINEIKGIDRIRFMTSHPKDLSDILIKAYGECDRLCKNIHLPVQSGSSRILARMNRHYDRDDYILLIEKLRDAVPDITISTDIIAGFPGETEDDFEDTLSIIEKVRFDSAFTFLYSLRPCTPAAGYKDQIPDDVKHRRFNEMVELINKISAEKNKQMEGRTELVLVDERSKKDPLSYAGRTDGFKLVNFPAGDSDMTGMIVPVMITAGKTFSLEGSPLCTGW